MDWRFSGGVGVCEGGEVVDVVVKAEVGCGGVEVGFVDGSDARCLLRLVRLAICSGFYGAAVNP